MTRSDGYAVTFAYDVLGQRARKRFRGRVTRWVWDGDKPLHEWHELEIGPGAAGANDVITWLFEEESFAPAAKLTAQGAYSVVCDHLGTPLSLYAGQSTATWQMNLDSSGAVRQGQSQAQDVTRGSMRTWKLVYNTTVSATTLLRHVPPSGPDSISRGKQAVWIRKGHK